MQTVALVSITQNGSDQAVFLNGEFISCADPSAGDTTGIVEQAANNLAKLFKVDVVEIEHAASEDWDWNQVSEQLRASGCL